MEVVIGVVVVVMIKREDNRMRPVCDRAVERLLTTHDPVELQRSRFLVERFDCSVSDRVKSWSAERTGGLKDDAGEHQIPPSAKP